MPEEAVDIVGFREMAFERLEPYDAKVSRTVLRGARELVTVLWAGNGPRLPGVGVACELIGRVVSRRLGPC